MADKRSPPLVQIQPHPPCCDTVETGEAPLPGPEQAFVTGVMQTRIGAIPTVSSTLTAADRIGGYRARWGIRRMNYTVDPGIYALGNPGDRAPVVVTANYKMSFDRLRAALPTGDIWILVLDTKGINVWCAAGKGSFGTDELVRRIESCGLANLVTHRELILPQLSAPGVAAHQIRKRSGFKVRWGPIRASDIPGFIDNGFVATPRMRRKTFPMEERAVLIPIELVAAMKWFFIIAPALFLLGGMGAGSGFWANSTIHGTSAALAVFGAILAGAVFTPLLLPWLPGRAFSLKGFWLGALWAGILAVFHSDTAADGILGVEIISWFLMSSAVASFLAMNFTGASTYTSLSGVKKEMKWAVPLQIGAGVVGTGLWFGSRIVG